MSNQPSTEANTYLDSDTRKFLRTVMASKLADVDDIKRVITALLVESPKFTPHRIADGLIEAGVLSKWQTRMLMRGKKRGFFLGNFMLRKPIGRGAMSVVYLGRHLVMQRDVALKILPPEEAGDERMVNRFRRESMVAAQLDHDNVVRVFEFGELGDKHFLAMEYVDGLNLHELVDRDGPMSIGFALDIIAQAACGLGHLHSMSIIHRDVKPTNLLIKHDGVVKIIDMGLAKMPNAELPGLAPNQLLGTADFVAPEQIDDSEGVDERADLYALGCTLYFLLAGQPPYPGKSVSLQLAKHQSAAIPDIRNIRPNCPTVIVDLLSRLLAKRPDGRPRSTAALIRQIQMIRGAVREKPAGFCADASGDTVVD